ncbi:hypothetical protein MSHOH_0200 [Methanosarcina horonobensis HB-1 = JCM 15518]|uniref:Sialidase domain-containing protein n=2 Tax=Methanosarcina horonobensis TaxID=418008 RepID=A0A0E3SBM1_9EURY|nr:hypothetical protein MSHOH_0200 [Methanosarcina horonobensis HB-1 = JCM 15518]
MLKLVLVSYLILCLIIPATAEKYNGVQNFNFPNVSLRSNDIFENSNEPLEIPTYDGSGQLTHPSVLYFSDGWNGHKYWAAATPYPNSDNKYENPSIYCFDVPYENWSVPQGLTNPVIPGPSVGFNSDPCLAHNKTSDELYCIYRDYNSTSQETKYLIVKTYDGVSWSNPVLLYNIPSNKITFCNRSKLEQVCRRMCIKILNVIHKDLQHGATNIERSNAIVQLPDGSWMMWAQKWDSECSIIYRTSTDGFQWSEPEDCVFEDDIYNKDVWHIEVKYIPEYKLFFMIQYSDVDKSLSWAESNDGIVWKYYPDKILKPDSNTRKFDNSSLYKSSITYDPYTDTIHMWYVGVNTQNEWKIGYTNASYATLQNVC